MDKESAAVVEQGGMPNGDDAEKALKVISQYVRTHGTPYTVLNVSAASVGLPPELFKELGNIRRCLVAFLALMRMHEAKKEHGVGEKATH